APIGYLNNGTGKPKTLDPRTAPLVRKAFEFYGSGRYCLASLSTELTRLGLRRPTGTTLGPNRLSHLLNNPFYTGVIRIKATNETYAGAHEPLVSHQLFERVQKILHRKTNTKSIKHDFQYRRRLVCKACQYSLTGERQKRHVYYRCHTSVCPRTCIREEAVDQVLLETFAKLQFSKQEHEWFRAKLARMKLHHLEERDKIVVALKLHKARVNERLHRLTDGYIDRLIEKELFEQRKSALLTERADIEQRLAAWQAGSHNPADDL